MRLDKNMDELVMIGKEGIRQVMAELFRHNVEVHPDDMDTIIDACETLGMSDEEIDELIDSAAR